MLFLHFSPSTSPLLHHLDSLLIFFLFLQLIIINFQILLLHPSFHFIFFSSVILICPFIRYPFNVLKLSCKTLYFWRQFVFTLLFRRSLLLLRLCRLFSKSSKILLLRLISFFSFFFFTFFDFSLNWHSWWSSFLILTLLTLLRLLSFFWLFSLIFHSWNFWICNSWRLFLLFRLNKGSYVKYFSFVLIQSSWRNIKLLVRSPPVFGIRQQSSSDCLRRNLILSSFLTDIQLFFFWLNSISNLFSNLISDLSLISPLLYQVFLLFGPFKNLFQSQNLISLSIEIGEITYDGVQSLIIHGLIWVFHLIIRYFFVVLVQLVDQIVVLLLIFQVWV